MKLCAVAECAQVVLTPIADETGDCEKLSWLLARQ